VFGARGRSEGIPSAEFPMEREVFGVCTVDEGALTGKRVAATGDGDMARAGAGERDVGMVETGTSPVVMDGVGGGGDVAKEDPLELRIADAGVAVG
jgi:hypothetical protein